jgi:hypothetical protein
MNVGIITRNENKSPKVLALSLQNVLQESNIKSELISVTGFLVRLQPLRFSFKSARNFLQRIKHLTEDLRLLSSLKKFDVLILSECIPNAFWRNHYAIEKLRRMTGRPVMLYEVYYLGNAPTQIEKLKANDEPLLERFDWHLSVSPVTEIRMPESTPWSCIGLDLSNAELKPTIKKEIVALVDFPHPGYEHYRELQLKVLAELGIKTICLEGSYTIEEIRACYRQASIYFMQSSEAFGLPIAECFSCGAVVFTASSSWPMSWRLDESPTVHGEGKLGEGLFYVYQGEEQLKSQLLQLIRSYDLSKTAFEVFNRFVSIYPHYYYGRPSVLKQVLEKFAVR